MKKLIVLAAMLLASVAHALPHDNRSDVDQSVKVFIPWNDFSLTADGTSIYVIGSGSSRVAQINSTGLSGIDINLLTSAAHIYYPIPDNICISCPVKISVEWSTAGSTTTQTATWKVRYSKFANGAALSAATTALDTVITADAVENVAYDRNETDQGVINANTLSRGDVVHFLVDLASTSGLDPVSTNVYLHGIYVEYTREQL